MKSIIYIHVGTHKTGTTSIQHFLRNNDEELRLEDDIRVLPVPDELKSLRNINEKNYKDLVGIAKKSVESLNKKDSKYVISWEGFCGWYNNNYKDASYIAKSLMDVFSDFSVHIIIGLREQSDFIESIFMQEVHTGVEDNIDDYIDKIDLKFNWLKLVSIYEDLIPKENLHLIEYNKKNNVIHEFGKIINSKLMMNTTSEIQRNVSFNMHQFDLASKVNKYLTDSERKTLRSLLQSTSQFGGSSKLISEDLAEKIYEENFIENETLKSKYNIELLQEVKLSSPEDMSYIVALAKLIISQNNNVAKISRKMAKLESNLKYFDEILNDKLNENKKSSCVIRKLIKKFIKR